MTPILCVSLISMFSHCGDLEAALKVYQQTKQQILKTDADKLFISLLTSASMQSDLVKGKLIHKEITESNIKMTPALRNTIINMYGQCNDFPAALEFHHETKHSVLPDEITYTCLLAACATHANLANGKKIHQEAALSGIKFSPMLRNAVLSMYGACGELNTALQIYYETKEQLKPTDVTYICLLSACSNSVMPNTGKLIHAELLNSQWQISLPLHNALITFYGCCGLIDDATSIFEKLFDGNAPLKLDSWNAIIAACSHNGYAKQALQFFEKMPHYNIMPDSFTFASVLSACSHAVDSDIKKQAFQLFEVMQSKYNILPEVIHYNCMIDVASRSGDFEEAEKLLKSMEAPNSVTYLTLQGASRFYRVHTLLLRLLKFKGYQASREIFQRGYEC